MSAYRAFDWDIHQTTNRKLRYETAFRNRILWRIHNLFSFCSRKYKIVPIRKFAFSTFVHYIKCTFRNFRSLDRNNNNEIMRIILILFFFTQILYSQIEDNIYKLNSLDNNFLTEDVMKIIDQNIEGKQTVFLGEAVHISGSDFLAKTEFVKYLATEHGYKDIAFEADF